MPATPETATSVRTAIIIFRILISNDVAGSRFIQRHESAMMSLLIQPDEAAPRRHFDRFRAAGDAELLEQVRKMGFHGALADVEPGCNFFVRIAVGQQLR